MRSTLVRTASRLALAIGLFAALVWLADTLSLSFRIPPRDPLGSFQVRKMYAVKKKNGSTDSFSTIRRRKLVSMHCCLTRDTAPAGGCPATRSPVSMSAAIAA